jgi:predicted transposase YdaD
MSKKSLAPRKAKAEYTLVITCLDDILAKSIVYQDISPKGREQGKQQGLQEGWQQGVEQGERRVVMRQLELRCSKLA